VSALTAAAWLGLAWSVVAAWLAIGTVLRRRRLDAAPTPALPTSSRRIVLARPCAGAEPELARCLGSAAEARRSLPIEVVFGVSTRDDGATPAIEAAMKYLRARAIPARSIVAPPIGPNHKASTLAAVAATVGEAGAILVNADSNVDLTEVDLDALVAPILVDPETALVWSPFAEHASTPSLGTRMSVAMLGGGPTSFPLLAAISPRSVSGKLWALDLDALGPSGGLAALAEHLGEDFEMERRLRAAGRRIRPTRGVARAIAPALHAGEAVHRVSRWMMVVRAQRPHLLWAYPLLFASTPFILALAAAGSPAAPGVAGAAAALALGARGLVTATARRYAGRGGSPMGAIVDAVLGDATVLLAWIRTLTTREVVWRGRRLEVGRDGALRAIDGTRT
jgi:ceramide glucosyltransferase